MKSIDFPYCIPHRRELSGEEIRLLKHLLKGNHTYENEIETLKVIARCGCGKCPTVLFGKTFDSQPLTQEFRQLAEKTGKADNGTIVGIALLERNHQIAELEAWSVCGGEVIAFPNLETLN